jgi:hypothetical protein
MRRVKEEVEGREVGESSTLKLDGKFRNGFFFVPE